MPRCRVVDCKVKYAVFNLPGTNLGVCCSTHKDDIMIDVINKKCKFDGCQKLPSFNYEGIKKPLYCNIHKLESMIRVINKKCLFDTCLLRPCFNFPNETKGIYCNQHKNEGMIDVLNKNRCQFDDCNIIANFNYPNEIRGIYCFSHKLSEMINCKKSNLCKHINCTKNASYNYSNIKQAIYCNTHKLIDMFNVTNKRCIYLECNIRPNYNYPNIKRAIYCNQHKNEGMVDVIHKKCRSENCTTHANPKYRGYCSRCFMYTFPDEPIAFNYKIKEKHVTDFINQEFKDYNPIFDKQINGGCSKKRPDIFIDQLTHSIIIEVDEDQHENYACENKRLMELFQDLGNRPIVLIRFNPDKYIDKNNKTIKSCFKYHKKTGVPIIDNETIWKERLETLKTTINKNLDNIPEKEVLVEHLYYNQ
jgi:hypothetical protein